MVQLLWATVGQVLKMLKLPCDHMSQEILLLGIYTQENWECKFIQKLVHECSKQYSYHNAKNGNNPNVYQSRKGHRKCDLSIQWNTIQPQKKLSTDTGYNTNESWKRYTKWKKPDLIEHIL